MRETDLYPAVKSYLESNGYEVRAEVKGIDVVARKGDELIAVELKTGINVKLLVQATKRQSVTASVYVAVPEPARRDSQFRGVIGLLKRLQVGLLLVRFGVTGPAVRKVLDPLPYTPRQAAKKRIAVIEELDGRQGPDNTAGSRGVPLMTAYRENAIVIAGCLALLGEAAPRALKAIGTGERTGAILYDNFYGWFTRVGHGVYRLSATGRRALRQHPELAEHSLGLVRSSRRGPDN